MVIDHEDRPHYHWEIRDDRIFIEVDPDNPPSNIRLWYAINTATRDFRIDQTGEIWKDSTLVANPEGAYQIVLKAPVNGWESYFVELTYPAKVPFKVTTGTIILPRIYPYDSFISEDPQGTQAFP